MRKRRQRFATAGAQARALREHVDTGDQGAPDPDRLAAKVKPTEDKYNRVAAGKAKVRGK